MPLSAYKSFFTIVKTLVNISPSKWKSIETELMQLAKIRKFTTRKRRTTRKGDKTLKGKKAYSSKRKLSAGVHQVVINGSKRKVRVLSSGKWRFMKNG